MNKEKIKNVINILDKYIEPSEGVQTVLSEDWHEIRDILNKLINDKN